MEQLSPTVPPFPVAATFGRCRVKLSRAPQRWTDITQVLLQGKAKSDKGVMYGLALIGQR
ncbi:hypothetical protein [Marivita hallyeonensis]|uniref:hypothetical protein n=1 Tax=Marivita hallyeonensis TaxID=996342 RepID=UPI0009331A90|nr:hypothetical protein [Marivita hallyeonensis]